MPGPIAQFISPMRLRYPRTRGVGWRTPKICRVFQQSRAGRLPGLRLFRPREHRISRSSNAPRSHIRRGHSHRPRQQRDRDCEGDAMKRWQLFIGLTIAARLAAQQFPVAGTLVNFRARRSRRARAHGNCAFRGRRGNDASDGRRRAVCLHSSRRNIPSYGPEERYCPDLWSANPQFADRIRGDRRGLPGHFSASVSLVLAFGDYRAHRRQHWRARAKRIDSVDEVRGSAWRTAGMVTAAWARTNDLGEYRFGGLPAGSYYTGGDGTAMVPGREAQPVRRSRPLAYATAYYPNCAQSQQSGGSYA